MANKIQYLILPIISAVLLCVPLLLGTRYYQEAFIAIGRYWSFCLVTVATLASLFIYMTFRNNKMVVLLYAMCLAMIFWDELALVLQKTSFLAG